MPSVRATVKEKGSSCATAADVIVFPLPGGWGAVLVPYCGTRLKRELQARQVTAEDRG